MLHTLDDLRGYDIEARDGEIGSVEDILFDDATWTVRYLVVDTGPWLLGREVLISPQSVGEADWEAGLLPVDLSKEQVESSPDVDLEKPVSRQKQEMLNAHYSWQNYWTTLPTTARYGTPGMTPPGVAVVEEEEVALKEAVSNDPNLRSADEVEGYHIGALDGEIGHVDNFIVDDETWAIHYMVVNTRNWLPGRDVLIALPWIDEITWEHAEVQVSLSKENIKNSPEYDPNMPLTRDYESRLHEHYGMKSYWM
jgi:sporulation protein YlmC with PRC-barrel domain